MAENFDGIVTSSGTIPAFAAYSSALLEWLQDRAKEGDRINKEDPGLSKMDDVIDYIQGKQPTSTISKLPSYIPQIIFNKTKKAIKAHVAALTDVKPMFAFKTPNPQYQDHAGILNNYAIIWWINTFADLELADVVKYALAGGCGDLVIEYDRHYNGGDTRATARDPRDTLPIRPERSRDIQDWLGLTIREEHTLDTMLSYFPDMRQYITPDSGLFPRAVAHYWKIDSGSGRRSGYTLDGLSGGNPIGKRAEALGTSPPTSTLHRTYLKDYQLNLTKERRLMGRPGSNWAYFVEPGKPLYPRGRLILWTEHAILYDGPNPDWHGRFPNARLKLDPWPWLFGGMGLMNDLRGAQDILNIVINDLLSYMQQVLGPGQVWDQNMPIGMRKAFDIREPNWKVVRKNQFSKGIEVATPPQLQGWVFQFLTLMLQQFDEQSGVANLQALLQARQIPGGDTVEKYLQALTPEIRYEARNLECFLRDVAIPIKSNLFQYQSAQRRYMLLGDAGRVLQDLDYDPETMIPAMAPGDPGYTPELDASLPRDLRAQHFLKAFSFYVAPNSMLAITSQERKMVAIQQSRQGYLDIWSLAEILDIPNMGDPPYIMLQKIGWKPDPDNPQAPPEMEYRQPRTVIERLQAQQQLQIGQTVSPAGRKASGEAPPKMKQRPDGSSTMTESPES